MAILDIMKKRRSVRAFIEKNIESEKIDAIKEALIWAPSAGNLQSRKFYFVSNEKLRGKLAEAGRQGFMREAPLVIVCCCDRKIEKRYGKRGWELYAIQDVSASIQNVLLLAQEMGLATCWVGAFSEDAVQAALNLPETLRPVSMIPIGYAADEPRVPKYLSESDLMEFVE